MFRLKLVAHSLTCTCFGLFDKLWKSSKETEEGRKLEIELRRPSNGASGERGWVLVFSGWCG